MRWMRIILNCQSCKAGLVELKPRNMELVFLNPGLVL